MSGGRPSPPTRDVHGCSCWTRPPGLVMSGGGGPAAAMGPASAGAGRAQPPRAVSGCPGPNRGRLAEPPGCGLQDRRAAQAPPGPCSASWCCPGGGGEAPPGPPAARQAPPGSSWEHPPALSGLPRGWPVASLGTQPSAGRPARGDRGGGPGRPEPFTVRLWRVPHPTPAHPVSEPAPPPAAPEPSRPVHPTPLQVLGHGVGRLAKAEIWKVLEEKKIGLYETNSMGKDLSPTPSSPGAGAAAGKGHQIILTKLTRTELLEHKVRQLLLALQRRDVIYVLSFLEDYHQFATTDEVLDLLFTEYGCIADAWGNNDVVLQCWKLAMSFMMEIWLNYYGDDFHQFPEFPSLIKLLQILRQHMPGTDAHLRALRHLRQFRRLHAAEREAGASARGKHPEPTLERTPAPTVGPAAPWGLAAGAEGLACDEPPAGEAKPLQIVVTAALQEPPAPLGALEEEQAPPPALEVVDVPQPPPNSMEQLASGMEQPVEPPEEPAPAPTVEPGEGSGSEGIVAAGDEDLVKAEMLAPEVKVVHVLVEPMVPCPDEEEPPAPMATPEE
ncbi:uncharacterized protein LOC144284122 [Canis aureus]